ncbi:MAG TPA: amino acid deaminase [Actinophytocola sp.]|uniref:amino acid deaminase n=1 Tax=Actinophytocola sp. TaxID=1872138 RepID=UPI002DB90636|nr:amino acid deaminase [Actinophytocola sp.]HEU5476027.1 amino acid deaminase [Actinophytocola sp.]
MEPGSIDQAAVAAIGTERIDWRFKGMPAAVAGMSIAEVRSRGLNLFRDGFLGPLLVLDGPALAANIATMARWCAARGLALAPHGKTTMAPQLFARQLEHGAWAITTANASQLRVYRAFGVSRIVLANQLVDPAALGWLAGELATDPGLEFCCWVDSERGVALMDRALRDAGATRPVDVLVELGAAGGRTGARDLPAALAVADAAAASPALRLVGVAGYEGAVANESTADAMATVRGYLVRLRELAVTLAGRGAFDGLDRVLVSAGGSSYFDLVADALTEPWPDGLPVLPVLRSGAYVTHDDGPYRSLSPLGATPRLDDAAPFRSALRAWAQVTSRPTADLALLTMGKRDAPYDLGLPEPQLIRSGDGVTPLPGCRVTALNDQHTFLAVTAGADPRVGDWVGFGLSHPCTTFDKWQLIPVAGADGETVVDLIRTYF